MNSPILAHTHKKAQVQQPLPEALQERVEAVSDYLIASEKEGYHNDLVPFSHYAEQIKEATTAKFVEVHTLIQQAENILKAQFEAQERSHTPVPENSSFSLFEEAAAALTAQKLPESEKPLMSRLELPWNFMDRCYEIGKSLLQEKKFAEAEAVFFFLRTLQPDVFEYWLGEATSQHELHRHEDAVETYCSALLLKPEEPLLFFQIADCFLQLKQYAGCLSVLELCEKYGNVQPSEKDHSALIKEARAMKQRVMAQHSM